MSVQAMTWAFDQDIPTKPKMVLMALADHADSKTGRCWPGLDTIGQKASVPERSLVRYIHALVRNGYIIRQKGKDSHGRQRNNIYWLVLDRDPGKYGTWQWLLDRENTDDADDSEASPTAMVADGPTAMVAPGEMAPPTATGGSSPTAIGGSQQPSPEPKSKVINTSSGTPRVGFSKDAQEADMVAEHIAALAENKNARAFVIFESRAWWAWCGYRQRHGGIGSMPLTTSTVNGKPCRGWWCPTLFPPADEPKASAQSPPTQAQGEAEEEDQQHSAQHGI